MRLLFAFAVLLAGCHHQENSNPPVQALRNGTLNGDCLVSTGNGYSVRSFPCSVSGIQDKGIGEVKGENGAVSLLETKTSVESGTLENGVCSICKKQGKKSTVTMNIFGTATAVMCGSYYDRYDENGKLLPKGPDCNTYTREGTCSNGHRVVESR